MIFRRRSGRMRAMITNRPIGHRASLLVATATVPGTFAPSLTDRSWVDQGVVTALSTGSTYLLTEVAHGLIDTLGEAVEPHLPRRFCDQRLNTNAGVLMVELAVIPASVVTTRLLRWRDGEPTIRGLLRQFSWRMGISGLSGVLLTLGSSAVSGVDKRVGANGRLQRIPIAVPIGVGVATVLEQLRQDRADTDTPKTRATDLLSSLGAAGTVVLFIAGAAASERAISRRLAVAASTKFGGAPTIWQLGVHAGATAVVAAVTSGLWTRAMQGVEAGTTAFEPSLDAGAASRYTTPMQSGNPASRVTWESLGREGRRHAFTYVHPVKTLNDRMAEIPDDVDLSIATVMREPAQRVPVQVYVGLDSAKTMEGRVDLAIAELDRTEAWDRRLLMLVSPTGTGYVNYCAVAAVEYMTLGDVATVTLQYAKRPSPLSLGLVPRAREQNRLLWMRILERVRGLPVEARPRVVLFGESLGAHTSQDVFMHWGTLGLQALGVDRALWIGTPYGSKWKEQVVGKARPDVDPDLVAVVNDFEQIRRMPNTRRSTLRYVLLNHDNDGVTKFGTDLLVHKPRWLSDDRELQEHVEGASPRGIPAHLRWRPLTTFFQSLVDMKNAQLSGQYRAWGHDYRPDLPAFLSEVYRLPITQDQLVRVGAAVEERERLRESLFT